MKAQCPAQCGRELGNESYCVCPSCYDPVPQRLKDAFVFAVRSVRRARKPMAVSAALKKKQEAREAIVGWCVDNNKVKATA